MVTSWMGMSEFCKKQSQAYNSVTRWLGLRLDLLGSLVTLAASVSVWVARESVSGKTTRTSQSQRVQVVLISVLRRFPIELSHSRSKVSIWILLWVLKVLHSPLLTSHLCQACPFTVRTCFRGCSNIEMCLHDQTLLFKMWITCLPMLKCAKRSFLS